MLLAGCATSPPAQHPGRAQQRTVTVPGEADRRFEQALELMRQGQRREAGEAFRQLAKDFPQASGPATNLGILAAQQNDAGQALQYLSHAVRANPRNAVAWNWLGILYRESGDYRAAEDAYRRALSLQPDYAAAHRNLAILYDAWLQRPERALAHYRRYLQQESDDLIVHAWVRELEAELDTRSHTTAARATEERR